MEEEWEDEWKKDEVNSGTSRWEKKKKTKRKVKVLRRGEKEVMESKEMRERGGRGKEKGWKSERPCFVQGPLIALQRPSSKPLHHHKHPQMLWAWLCVCVSLQQGALWGQWLSDRPTCPSQQDYTFLSTLLCLQLLTSSLRIIPIFKIFSMLSPFNINSDS